MSEIALRHPRNAAGRYYVDSSCVRCKLCHEIAPRHFTKTEDHDGLVNRQPANEAEEQLCQIARESCPVNAIGDDGSDRYKGAKARSNEITFERWKLSASTRLGTVLSYDSTDSPLRTRSQSQKSVSTS